MARHGVATLVLVVTLGGAAGPALAQQAPPYAQPSGSSEHDKGRMIVYFRSVAATPLGIELSCAVPDQPAVWTRLRLKARAKFLFWDVFDSTRFICADPAASKLVAKVRPCSGPASALQSSFIAGEKVTFAPSGSGVCALSTSP